MSDGIVEFIEAQLDEDDAIANDAREGRPNGVWTFEDRSTHATAARWLVKDELGYEVTEDYHLESQPWWTLPHIARHDPARVLAEVAAKRRVLERHHPAADGEMAWHVGACIGCGTEGEFADPRTPDVNDRPELRDLAAPYASRPGFKPEWALT